MQILEAIMSKTNYDRRQSANIVNPRKLFNGKWKIFCLVLGLLCVKCSLYANIYEDNALKEQEPVDKNDNLSKDLKKITAEKDPLIINPKELTRPTSAGNQKESSRATSERFALEAADKNASVDSEKRIQELENHLNNTFAENDKLEKENYLLREENYELEKENSSLRSDRYKLSEMVSHSIGPLQSLYYELQKIINKLDKGFDAHFQQNFKEDKKIFSLKKKDTDESE